ncbi:MAG: histidine phosphatase family protein [Candidatus Omnitrophica bacterium]|nr:histidine phosphatase family protein [Candidatus Omnitrophota bacterium]
MGEINTPGTAKAVGNSRTTILIIRHGQTQWNVERRIQGHDDSALTAIGIAQAESLAARLRTDPCAALYSSDLRRALQTAQIVARQCQAPLHTAPELRERNHGIFQGLTFAEAQEKYPAEYARYMDGGPDYVIPSGESKRQFQERAWAWFLACAQRHRGQTVAVVTHGGVLKAMVRAVLNVPLAGHCSIRLYNGSINRFAVDERGWTIETLGDTAHLRDITAFTDVFQ